MTVVLDISDDSKRYLHAIRLAIQGFRVISMNTRALPEEEFRECKSKALSLLDRVTGTFDGQKFAPSKGFETLEDAQIALVTILDGLGNKGTANPLKKTIHSGCMSALKAKEIQESYRPSYIKELREAAKQAGINLQAGTSRTQAG